MVCSRLYAKAHRALALTQRVRESLAQTCKAHLHGSCGIGTIDVSGDFAAAPGDNVLAPPALVMVKPEPRVAMPGGLSDAEKALLASRFA
jgi:hypothetical protein